MVFDDLPPLLSTDRSKHVGRQLQALWDEELETCAKSDPTPPLMPWPANLLARGSLRALHKWQGCAAAEGFEPRRCLAPVGLPFGRAAVEGL